MPTPRKRETVRDLHKLFTDSQVLVFTDYRGLKVSDITNLRRQLRDKGVEYHVSKNTLTTLAAGRSGIEQLGSLLDGPTAIAFVQGDIPSSVKVLTDFVRTSRILQIRGGLMGQQILSADQIDELTKLLTREQYIAQFLGALQAPIANFVSAINSPLQGLVNVLQAHADKQSEPVAGESGEPAPETEGENA